jgi:hypothetical protein
MAKTEVVKWADGHMLFSNENVKQKSINRKNIIPISFAVLAGVTFALHGDFTAFASTPPEAVAAFAQEGANTADFADQLRKATKPIRDVIFAFGHEIYFVMMAWGGIEALIGKTQQGFTRMKASTAAYVVLYWVPWIVETVNKAVPHQ